MNILTKEQLKEIADDLSTGMDVYWNPESGELLQVPGDSFDVYVEELWAEQLEKLENDFLSYKKFEGMPSKVGFQVMEDFAETLSDKNPLKRDLMQALARPKPFSKFKWIVEGTGKERDEWFAFRDQRWLEWVEKRYQEIIASEQE